MSQQQIALHEHPRDVLESLMETLEGTLPPGGELPVGQDGHACPLRLAFLHGQLAVIAEVRRAIRVNERREARSV